MLMLVRTPARPADPTLSDDDTDDNAPLISHQKRPRQSAARQRPAKRHRCARSPCSHVAHICYVWRNHTVHTVHTHMLCRRAATELPLLDLTLPNGPRALTSSDSDSPPPRLPATPAVKSRKSYDRHLLTVQDIVFVMVCALGTDSVYPPTTYDRVLSDIKEGLSLLALPGRTAAADLAWTRRDINRVQVMHTTDVSGHGPQHWMAGQMIALVDELPCVRLWEMFGTESNVSSHVARHWRAQLRGTVPGLQFTYTRTGAQAFTNAWDCGKLAAWYAVDLTIATNTGRDMSDYKPRDPPNR